MDKLIQALKNELAYNPNTGLFFWIKRKQGRRNGWFYGSVQSDGYMQINLLGKRHLAHRLAWIIFHGSEPQGIIDHINGIRSDNRIENLREATSSQNMHNSKLRSRNKSGFKGVFWEKNANCWRSQICVRGSRIHIGYFNTPEEASDAYKSISKQKNATGLMENT